VPHQLHWRELTGGIIALVTIVLLTLVVLIFARVGSLHGKKVTLYVVTDEAPGVLAGTEVWLAGEREGTVKDVSFRPPTTDTLARLLITTEFLKQGLSNVRRDSYAQIRPGGTMIGTPIVYISPGTTAAAGIAFINSVGNLGGFFGPYIIGLVRTSTGQFRGGMLVVAAALAMSGALVLTIKLNRKPLSS